MKITQEQFDAIETKSHVDESIVRQVMSRVPPSWLLFNKFPAGGAFRRNNLQVIFTVQRYEQNGCWDIWVHVSVCARNSTKTWYPNWEELKRVKHDFIGEDQWAYQVFPSSKEYINHHPHVLHLYAKLEGESALPDFTLGLGTI